MAKSSYYQSQHWEKLRTVALTTYGFRCNKCGASCRGKRAGEPRPFVDHVLPRPHSDQPTAYDTIHNLQVLCQPCHNKKTKYVDENNKQQVRDDGFPSDGSWG